MGVKSYYKKNPQAVQNIKGALYEDKIIQLLKSKIKLTSKTLSTLEAEKVISEFNGLKTKAKSKKISKK